MVSRPSHSASASISASTALVTSRAERDVLVDRVYAEDGALAIGCGAQLPDESVVVEDRQGEEALASLGLGLVDLEDVLEVEQLDGPLAVEVRRSNGESRAARPSNGWARCSGSTR